MADGSVTTTIKSVVEEAMQQGLLFGDLRKQVLAWIVESGGRWVSVDRQDGVILIDHYTPDGTRTLVKVPETATYQTAARHSTW
jgi:hypothetical protein